mgnify:FL=1
MLTWSSIFTHLTALTSSELLKIQACCHANKITANLNSKIQCSFNDDTLLKEISEPHLIYGMELRGHALDYALEQILICQKKVLRIICHRSPIVALNDMLTQ